MAEKEELLRESKNSPSFVSAGYFELLELDTFDMKIRSSIKKISADDIIVRRKGRLYRINKKNPRHKARQ